MNPTNKDGPVFEVFRASALVCFPLEKLVKMVSCFPVFLLNLSLENYSF